MSLSSLIEQLKVNDYQVEHYTKTDNDLHSISVFRAKKGKLFSKKLLIFTVDSFEDKFFDKLINIIKEINKKNDLCLVLCNTKNTPDSQTLYMADNGNGVCLIHFIYCNKAGKYIYNLDFHYSQSKIVKEAILELVKN